MAKTEKLKFPIIKEPLPAARRLPMDAYLKFVTFNPLRRNPRSLDLRWKGAEDFCYGEGAPDFSPGDSTLKYTVDRKAARKQRKLAMVNVPFVLK